MNIGIIGQGFVGSAVYEGMKSYFDIFAFDKDPQKFSNVRSIFEVVENTEVTFEVNPGTVQEDALELWKQLGINRLSIGVQSLKDTVLQGLNRHQTKIDVINLLQKTGPIFENVSVDFICSNKCKNRYYSVDEIYGKSVWS